MPGCASSCAYTIELTQAKLHNKCKYKMTLPSSKVLICSCLEMKLFHHRHQSSQRTALLGQPTSKHEHIRSLRSLRDPREHLCHLLKQSNTRNVVQRPTKPSDRETDR